MVEDIKASPQGSGSPAGTAQQSPQDRAAAKRAELRRMEQERRRREAVSFYTILVSFFFQSYKAIRDDRVILKLYNLVVMQRTSLLNQCRFVKIPDIVSKY